MLGEPGFIVMMEPLIKYYDHLKINTMVQHDGKQVNYEWIFH